MSWFEIFNERETALLIWVGVAFPFAMWSSTVRGLIVGVWRTFARATTLHKYLFVTLCWVALEVWFLWRLGFWSVASLKGTLLWTLAIPIFGTWQLHRKAQKEHFVGGVLKDTFKLVVILEFIVDFYPMNLWIEIVLVPLTTFLVLFHETGKRQEGAEAPTSVIGWLLAIIGIVIVGHALLNAFRDLSTLLTVGTLSDFAGPIVLTLLFLPYLFGVAVYVTYANTFRRNSYAIPDPKLRDYAKFHALLAFGLNLELLRRWSRDLNKGYGESKDGLRLSIRTTLEAYRREKTAIEVPRGEGWDPNLARDFLKNEGLQTNDYHADGPEQELWIASSSPKEFDSQAFSNNVAYYISGDESVARHLKIALNLNDPDTAIVATMAFGALADALAPKATGELLPDEAAAAIDASEDYRAILEGFEVIFESHKFPSGNGSKSIFIIRQLGWIEPWTEPLRADGKP